MHFLLSYESTVKDKTGANNKAGDFLSHFGPSELTLNKNDKTELARLVPSVKKNGGHAGLSSGSFNLIE